MWCATTAGSHPIPFTVIALSRRANRKFGVGRKLAIGWLAVPVMMTIDDYSIDPRFEAKKPFRMGSRKQSCGDNIYFRSTPDSDWSQRDSFHSRADGQINPQHVARDTGVNRVLISGDFIYFGGTGRPSQTIFRIGTAGHYAKEVEVDLVLTIPSWSKGGLGRNGQRIIYLFSFSMSSGRPLAIFLFISTTALAHCEFAAN